MLADVACPEEITIVTGLTFGIANTTRCPERWRFGAVWCAEHQEFLKLRLTTIKGRQPRKKFVRAGRATVPDGWKGEGRRSAASLPSGSVADGPEWGGDFVEPWMELDGLRQLLDAEINGAAADAVAVGVAVNPLQHAWLADGQHEAVKLAVAVRNHGGDGAEGVKAGGVFVGPEVAGVGHVTSAVRAALAIMKCLLVGVISHDDKVCDVALLLFARHEAQNGVGDLLLIELRLAGLVEITGGGAKLFVGEIVERLVNGHAAAAESVAVKGATDAGNQGVVLMDACLEGEPSGLVTGGGDFGIPLAGSAVFGKGSHKEK